MEKKDGSSVTIKQFMVMIILTICGTILVAHMFKFIDAPKAVIEVAEEVIESEIEDITGIPIDIKSEEIREIVNDLTDDKPASCKK